MNNKLNWSILKSKYIVKDKWISLRADTCMMPEGKIVEPYYVLEYPEWVNIVAVTENKEIILIEQYRHGIGKTCIELPCGCMENGDGSPMDAARRELMEETGFGGGKFIETCRVSANPSNHCNITYCYLALDVKPLSRPRPDDTEQINVILKPLNCVIDMIETHEFLQALHVTSLFYGLRYLGNIKMLKEGPKNI